jgi:hypothetical protein
MNDHNEDSRDLNWASEMLPLEPIYLVRNYYSKTDLEEIGCEDVKCIHVTQNKVY